MNSMVSLGASGCARIRSRLARSWPKVSSRLANATGRPSKRITAMRKCLRYSSLKRPSEKPFSRTFLPVSQASEITLSSSIGAWPGSWISRDRPSRVPRFQV
ncbi:hypothetical protein D3C84_899210 [compost metagenome]